MELTILMPCLNEEKTIQSCINKAKQALFEHDIFGEVLVADNGSYDNSYRIAQSLGARVIHVQSKGYGNTINAGITEAKGKYIIMGDSDDSYDFYNIMPFLILLRNGNDLVMGNRFIGGIEKKAMPWLHKYLGNPVLSFLGKLFYKIPIGDFHCGLRGFNRESMLKIGLSSPGMEFASEMLVKSSFHNLKITEIPVKLFPDGRGRPSHLRTWRDGWRHLRFLLTLNPTWLFFYPGLLFMFAGVVITCALFPGPLKISDVVFDIHTMLYSAISIVIGLQLLSFYFFSKLLFAGSVFLYSNWKQKFNRYFSLEKGIALGMLFCILGAIFTGRSVFIWDQKAFGNLDPIQVLRLVIPSVTFVLLGIQIIINSFFASVLGQTSIVNYA